MSAQPAGVPPAAYPPVRSRGHGSGSAAPRPRSVPAAAPRIHLVRTPASSRSRVPYVLFCMAIVAAAFIGVLLLNTTMARGSYEARDLQSQIAQLAQTEQALLAELDEKSSAASLGARARALGMVQDSTPAFVRLADGAIIGDPTPAEQAAP